MEDSVRIPSTRIAALIGKEGKTKRKIEKLTECRIMVDSKSGEATIEAEEGGKNFYNALNIIRAIARGFSPEKALLLLDENYLLEILKLEDFLAKKKFEVKRARVIGSRGRAREEITKKTGCQIAIFGKTISLIGLPDSIEVARKAVEMLLGGATHETVYRFIDRRMGEREDFEL